MSGESVRLPRDQQRLIQTVYDGLRERGDWPRFVDVDRQLDRGKRRLDAARLLAQVPASMVLPISYPASHPDQPIQLTLEGVACCRGSDDDVDLALETLRWMARLERRYVPPADARTSEALVNGKQFMRSKRIPKSRTADVQRVGRILVNERFGRSTYGVDPEGMWNASLSRDVRRFAQVRTLEDYLAVKREWDAENQAANVQMTAFMSSIIEAAPTSADELAEVPPAVAAVYVGADVVTAIDASQGASPWDCRKLLEFIRELNDNVERGNAHAACALLRAILDHVPLLFGHTGFDRVVANFPWSRTDKNLMRQLANFRDAADDALHRQISKKRVAPLAVHDLPQRRAVNRLLEECALRL